MTVSYSFNISQATFAGFAKLLFRWRGSIFKSMWREIVIFWILFLTGQLILRHSLTEEGKLSAWNVIKFVDAIVETIPFNFVLGFYVSFVASRWSSQFQTLPWPDRVSHLISAYVHGSDERSRMIRRTLGRYAVQVQILTLLTVSTSVKRRFPTTRHLVEAGLMTAEEWSIYEKVDFPYGKWWLPCHWFTTLATRAKKEGRIKDSILLKELLKEMLDYRIMCATTIAYDWVNVPLAYTQVATITTYLYALTLLIGKQTLDIPGDYTSYLTTDYYFPWLTTFRFIFSNGWLKVAQQLLNPYGEDDDDFELNWCIDRGVNLTYKVVDEFHMMHPKVKKDAFWDLQDIKLPQTAHSAKYMRNPELGTACKLEIEKVDYLPLDELCEKDSEEHMYNSQSLKRKEAGRQNSSFIRRMFSTKFGQSSHKKSHKAVTGRSKSCNQGISNPVFSISDENDDAASTRSTPPSMRRSSQTNLVKTVNTGNKHHSAKLRPKNSIMKRQKSYNEPEVTELRNAAVSQRNSGACETTINTRRMEKASEKIEADNKSEGPRNDFEPNPEEHSMDVLMPPIPEEASRANSLASIELVAAAQRGERPSIQMDRVFDIVKGASEALHEIREVASAQERWKENEGKGYESCCSGISSEELSEGSSPESSATGEQLDEQKIVVTIEDPNGRTDFSK